MTETLLVATGAGALPVYRATARGPLGAVVVVHEGYGVDEHIREVARRFADAGFVAYAPDLFFRDGLGPLAPRRGIEAADRAAALKRSNVDDDMDAVLALVTSEGWSDGQIGVVGFGIGGGVALTVAGRRALGAAVSLYPIGITDHLRPRLAVLPDDAQGLRTPWLALYGDADVTIPRAGIAHLEALLNEHAGVHTEIVRLAGAGHGFHCDLRPTAYVHAAAFEAWQRTLEWLTARLEPPPTEMATLWRRRHDATVR